MEREPHPPAIDVGMPATIDADTDRRSPARALPWLLPWALAIAGTLLTLALTR